MGLENGEHPPQETFGDVVGRYENFQRMIKLLELQGQRAILGFHEVAVREGNSGLEQAVADFRAHLAFGNPASTYLDFHPGQSELPISEEMESGVRQVLSGIIYEQTPLLEVSVGSEEEGRKDTEVVLGSVDAPKVGEPDVEDERLNELIKAHPAVALLLGDKNLWIETADGRFTARANIEALFVPISGGSREPERVKAFMFYRMARWKKERGLAERPNIKIPGYGPDTFCERGLVVNFLLDMQEELPRTSLRYRLTESDNFAGPVKKK